MPAGQTSGPENKKAINLAIDGFKSGGVDGRLTNDRQCSSVYLTTLILLDIS